MNILSVQFIDNTVYPVLNEIIEGLYDCLQSPFESISKPAIR